MQNSPGVVVGGSLLSSDGMGDRLFTKTSLRRITASAHREKDRLQRLYMGLDSERRTMFVDLEHQRKIYRKKAADLEAVLPHKPEQNAIPELLIDEAQDEVPDHLIPDYMVSQRRGWMTLTRAAEVVNAFKDKANPEEMPKELIGENLQMDLLVELASSDTGSPRSVQPLSARELSMMVPCGDTVLTLGDCRRLSKMELETVTPRLLPPLHSEPPRPALVKRDWDIFERTKRKRKPMTTQQWDELKECRYLRPPRSTLVNQSI
ncbi:hypothetical protein CAPTEDRAFT_202724 [Capitella teleta]|uniref:Uncharacterized protein n=1 Tax=Capitella teleta TaxID=283909 RepID=R7UG20_CAPTE|nr:hypothetical protein CAPTEDRAFT_202724 [Capitella teleta]|eukprot:ELU05479.1 hypothetical protein CAPTEDRAFT_202724 [Capitella teleta]